ncbi:MAG: hypothetical protein PHN49_07655, partial [Candidatus Omnitrophica bacterium]|nr:hypothetical protein [Candidatus Omnitrophota bacterium]
MAAVFNPREGEYYGIEDWPLYEDNYFAYLKASEVKEKLLERIRELEKDFDGRRQKDYTPSLNRYHEQASDFWNDQADLSGLLQYFKEAGWVPDLQKDPSFSKSYPHLAALTEMEEQEKAQDRQDLEASIRRLGETFKQRYAQQLDPELQKWFNGQWQAYSAGLMSGAEFLRGVVDLGKAANLRPKLTPAMKKLLGHYQTLTAMKGSLLFDELAAFLDEIEKQLVQTPAQKELAGQYKRVRLIRNMARCELTRDELDQYEQDPEVYLSLLGNERENLGAAIEFYRLALERDEAFRRNIKSLLKARKRKLAVFVAGGFHTRGVERVMRAEGYSYAVIMPKIRGIEGGELYDGLMHGNLSYKKYLETSFYDAFMRHASLQLVADLKEEDFKRSLKLWRDDVIRRLAGEGRIAEAGDYTRYIDQLFELYRRKFGDGKQPQSRDEIVRAIRAELENFRESTFRRLTKQFGAQLETFTSGLKDLVNSKAVTQPNVRELMSRVARSNLSTVIQPARVTMMPGGYVDQTAMIAAVTGTPIDQLWQVPSGTGSFARFDQMIGTLDDVIGNTMVQPPASPVVRAEARNLYRNARAAERIAADVALPNANLNGVLSQIQLETGMDKIAAASALRSELRRLETNAPDLPPATVQTATIDGPQSSGDLAARVGDLEEQMKKVLAQLQPTAGPEAQTLDLTPQTERPSMAIEGTPAAAGAKLP